MTKPRSVIFLFLVTVLMACRSQNSGPAAQPVLVLWDEAPDSALAGLPSFERPSAFRLLTLNEELLRQRLADTALPVAIPLPSGGFIDFMINESTTLDPALLEKFPHLRTYRGTGADDPATTGRFDFAAGFHGYLLTPGGSVIINPVDAGGRNYYICYYKHHAAATKRPFEFNADSVIHRE